PDEWMTARAARALRAQWSEWSGFPEQDRLEATLRNAAEITAELLVNKGAPELPLPKGQRRSPLVTPGRSKATPHSGPPSQRSLAPSCGVADARGDRAPIWGAAEGTDGNGRTVARSLGLPPGKVRLI